jgi:hypothetical protein
MVAQVLTVIVFTLLGGLGFTVLFGLLESYSDKRAAGIHTVGQFQQAIPLVIAISLLLVALRIINIAANQQGMEIYWLLINLQLLIMMYSDLMIDSFWAFCHFENHRRHHFRRYWHHDDRHVDGVYGHWLSAVFRKSLR